MAIEHARQVARNHVRRDGTTYHVVEYNPETAAINKRYTYQGYADNSTWARGQAWALAGFAIMARETGRREFLVTAQKLADKWLQLVTQRGEFVPVWDFDAPYRPSLNGPRDSSAAAVASLGLLTLSEALQASEGLQLGLPRGSNPSCSRRYLCAAVNTLRALTSPTYLGAGQGGAFAAVLRHGVGNLPANKQVDVGLVYGDYYYLAALQKCRSMRACGSFVE
jgi:unsaturated chondroitin disaccharide hydrolase